MSDSTTMSCKPVTFRYRSCLISVQSTSQNGHPFWKESDILYQNKIFCMYMKILFTQSWISIDVIEK